MHLFDERGNVRLEEGRFGICGDLAAYAYQEIRPLFDERFRIEFLRAAESNFFPPPLATHYVVRIVDNTDKSRPRGYVLDPSFGRYGAAEDFEDYFYYETVPPFPHLIQKDPDHYFPVDAWTPIRIRRQFLFSLAVESRQGRYDADNFGITLYVTRRHHYSGRRIFSVGLQNGRKSIYEGKKLAYAALSSSDYDRLRNRLLRFYEQILRERAKPATR